MLKKTITYTGFDDVVYTEDFYFNITKAEIAELELSQRDGLSEYLKKIIESKDGGKIMEAFKEIILKSVGKRTEDGKGFLKSKEISEAFHASPAYSDMFLEIVTDAPKSAEFIRAIMPKDLTAKLEAGGPLVENVPVPDEPAWVLEKREPTQKELQSMSPKELQRAFRMKGQA